MSKPSELSLHLILNPSTLQRRLQDALHGVALLACVLNGLSLSYRLLLVVTVLVLWLRSRKRRSHGPCYLRHLPNQGWSLSHDGEHYQAISILPSTTTMSLLTVLHYAYCETPNKFRMLLILRADTQVDDYRRLYVRLRLSA